MESRPHIWSCFTKTPWNVPASLFLAGCGFSDVQNLASSHQSIKHSEDAFLIVAVVSKPRRSNFIICQKWLFVEHKWVNSCAHCVKISYFYTNQNRSKTLFNSLNLVYHWNTTFWETRNSTSRVFTIRPENMTFLTLWHDIFCFSCIISKSEVTRILHDSEDKHAS